MKEVMVQGGAVGFGAGATVSGGSFVITAVPSLTAKVDGKGIYAGPLAWTFSGGNGPGAAPGSVMGAGSISPGSTSCKIDGLSAMLKDDQVTATLSGLTPQGAPISFPGQPVKVTNAGQTSVKVD